MATPAHPAATDATHLASSAPADYGDAIAEYTLFFSIGVDGLFSDNADTAVTARTVWIAEGRPHVAA